MNRFAIIVAGGTGQRFGSTIPKQFLNLKGLPILMHTIGAFYSYDSNIQIIVTLPANYMDMWHSLCAEYKFKLPHKILAGGETRFHSVLNGLAVIESEGIVAVHDAVRPLVSKETLQRCFETAIMMGNAVPAIIPVDSIRELVEDYSRPVNRDSFRIDSNAPDF